MVARPLRADKISSSSVYSSFTHVIAAIYAGVDVQVAPERKLSENPCPADEFYINN